MELPTKPNRRDRCVGKMKSPARHISKHVGFATTGPCKPGQLCARHFASKTQIERVHIIAKRLFLDMRQNLPEAIYQQKKSNIKKTGKNPLILTVFVSSELVGNYALKNLFKMGHFY